MIYGLDPSLDGFGWAEISGSGLFQNSGRIHTSPKDIFVSRHWYIKQTLSNVIKPGSAVGIESVAFDGTQSEGLYALYTHTMEVLWQKGCDVVLFDPTTLKYLTKEKWEVDPDIKKFITMDKPEMMQVAAQLSGVSFRSSDEADAYLAGYFADRFWQLYDGRISIEELGPSERKTFAGIKQPTKGKNAGQIAKTGVIFRENNRFFRFSRHDLRFEG